MHPHITSEKPERCSICGMKLVLQDEVHTNPVSSLSTNESYTPLVIIVGILLFMTGIFSVRDGMMGLFSLSNSLSYFMIGFFLVFGSFKLLDLKGFAEGYATYDLLAKKWFTYGYIYPFIELFFASMMILHLFPKEILIIEVIIMTFSGIGVARKLLRKEKFQCACLGTFLKVPLTKITLIEDFGMAVLALCMLLLGY